MIRALLVAAMLAGCGGSATTDCEPVPRTTLDAIEDGLTVQGGGSLSTGRAKEGTDWWYVAAEIDGPGLEEDGDIGVWAMPAPDEPGPIFAAEAFAREFSDWGTAGTAETLEQNLGVSRSEARDAADCL